MKFDRKNQESKQLLGHLRRAGSARLDYFATNYQKQSKALDIIQPYLKWRGEKGIFVDCGCGEAPETFIMAKQGWFSIGLDLYPLDKNLMYPYRSKYAEDLYNKFPNTTFILQDICEEWNKKINLADVIHCYSMITLLTREDRKLFYKQAFEHLKIGGLFIIYFQRLLSGYDFKRYGWEEKKDDSQEDTIKHSLNLLEKIGFKILDWKSNWILATK